MTANSSFIDSVRAEYLRVRGERAKHMKAFQKSDSELRSLRSVLNAYGIAISEVEDHGSASEAEAAGQLRLVDPDIEVDHVEPSKSSAQIMREVIGSKPGMKSSEVLDAYLARTEGTQADRSKAMAILKYVRSAGQVELKADGGNYLL